MKISLCLYGVVGGASGKADYAPASLDILKLGYEKYKKSLFDHHDVDIYIHSWSKDQEQNILELYKPRASIIEAQEVFDIPDYVAGDSAEQPRRRQGCYSRWRSTQKVLDLKASSGETYDFNLVSRFDVGFENPIDFTQLNKNELYVSNWIGAKYENVTDIFEDGRGLFYDQEDQIDESKLQLYGRGYPYNNEGLMDLWMLGSDQTIGIFKTLFDNLNNYQMPGNVPCAPLVSNHQLLLYHIKQSGLIQNLRLITNPMKDHCILRYKYFQCKDSYITTLRRSS
tara:strand:- start:272 stop:1120 length:849 start_codon:yes stop_codon:yes gene_type:complete